MKVTSERISEPPPYRRWFFWLLFGTILTLASPYFWRDNREDKVYSPEIFTFVETEHGFQPPSERIHIDGRTFAFINASDWLHFPLAIVALEAAIWAFRRSRPTRRTGAALPSAQDS